LASYTSLLSGSPRLGRLMSEYLRWPYGRCARVFVPSAATAAALDAARVARGKHVLWVRGVDTTAFSPDRHSAALRESWARPADTPVVIYVGRLSREKGVLEFVAVAERLRAQRRAHKLVFVGDGPLRAELASRLPDSLCTGSVGHEAVGAYLASADVFAFPSRTDTAGNVVLEAQACGLPAVVRAEGGPRENVVPGRTAIVSADTDEFAAAIDGLLGDHARRAEMGNAARRYALTRDWPTALAPLFSAYRQLAVRAEGHLIQPSMAIVDGRRH
jgi:glycosyltransferase involved in cell wall biosynthesis